MGCPKHVERDFTFSMCLGVYIHTYIYIYICIQYLSLSHTKTCCEDMRKTFLKATFAAADYNNNGRLSASGGKQVWVKRSGF